MNIRLLAIFCFFAISLLSCRDEELKIPTNLQIDFGVTPEEFAIPGNGSSYSLHILKATVLVKHLEFEGYRESGDNVFFDKSFSKPLKIEMLGDSVMQELKFEVPQGVYNHIGIKLSLTGDNAHGAFDLKSLLKVSKGRNYNVDFTMKFDERLDLTAKSESGEEQIVLSKDKNSICRIDFKPLFVFELMQDKDIDDAEMTHENGKYTIPLNSEVNSDIYTILVSRFAKAFDATVK